MYKIIIIIALSLITKFTIAQDKVAEEKIKMNLKEMGEAMQTGDAATLASYFTEDAYFKLPGQPPVNSRLGIQKVHEGMIENGVSIRPLSEEVIAADEYAIEKGSVEMMKEGDVVAKAVYLTLWKKTDDGWKIHRDVVSAMPPVKKE